MSLSTTLRQGADRKADIVDSIATIVKEVDIPTNLRNFDFRTATQKTLSRWPASSRLLVNN